ncbi:ABC transporter permease [Paenibacillus hexagrammi]|uniref:ABC-2 family transporter protein n=1 Tax=Paenibacillus hexagrammi TaxID=2908839 RepID=A0ABY3SQU3_9BACL|nr:ABC-2 family transporter protein [Paenibacillus sp. YPD9-1]UJF35526.1 ABC-2 family transporter protein [Paenibacillus sp. YPD9-1]
MAVYKKYMKSLLGLQNSMEYRTDFFIDMLSGIFAVVIQCFLWTVIFNSSSSDNVYGYTYEQLITYTILAGVVAKLLSTGFENVIAADIKDGGLSKFLVQPIGYFQYRVFCFIGQKISQIAFLLLIVAAMLLTSKYALNFQMEMSLPFLALLPLFLSAVLNFLIFYCVSTIAFWMLDVSMLFWGINLLTLILSGAIFPLDIFGERWLRVMEYLPFTYTAYFSLNVLTGKVIGNTIVEGIVVQLIWICIFGVLSAGLWRMGMKKYVAVGG